MIVYQLELKSKFRLMCEGGYNNNLKNAYLFIFNISPNSF